MTDADRAFAEHYAADPPKLAAMILLADAQPTDRALTGWGLP